MARLPWPPEIATAPRREAAFAQEASNLVLDFHGDPAAAALCVLSDGNHYMALGEALGAFARARRGVGEPFYVTAPPRVLLELLAHRAVRIGNLRLEIHPHVIISPSAVLARLAADGEIRTHAPFARHRGCLLLVSRGNPKDIRGIADLGRADVRLFLSNPVTEKVSFELYIETLKRTAARAGVALDFLDAHGSLAPRLVLGELIHHREAPLAVASGAADCALLLHHLALRCARAFPDRFETAPLGHEDAHPRGDTEIALVGGGGEHGATFVDFMLSRRGADIYERHGLDPVARSSA